MKRIHKKLIPGQTHDKLNNYTKVELECGHTCVVLKLGFVLPKTSICYICSEKENNK